jgi:hypothetical protein
VAYTLLFEGGKACLIKSLGERALSGRISKYIDSGRERTCLKERHVCSVVNTLVTLEITVNVRSCGDLLFGKQFLLYSKYQ